MSSSFIRAVPCADAPVADSRARRRTWSLITDAERDCLVNEHLGLVYHVARQMAGRLTVSSEFDELVSAGTVGLMSALEAFDASRGLALSSFAAPRIRGAILDELRRQDHAPRSVRRKGRRLAAARKTLATALGRTPEDAEVSTHLGIDRETFWRWKQQVASADHVELDAPSNGKTDASGDRAASGPRIRGELTTQESDSAEARLEREERSGFLREAILVLKEQQRVVVSLYYFEELSMAQIATVLGVTESRVCQIHRQALRSLREMLHAPLNTAA
jgi:RNA polymerase sigma factor FliA